mgnify:CR=1 FL=1
MNNTENKNKNLTKSNLAEVLRIPHEFACSKENRKRATQTVSKDDTRKDMIFGAPRLILGGQQSSKM